MNTVVFWMLENIETFHQMQNISDITIIGQAISPLETTEVIASEIIVDVSKEVKFILAYFQDLIKGMNDKNKGKRIKLY